MTKYASVPFTRTVSFGRFLMFCARPSHAGDLAASKEHLIHPLPIQHRLMGRTRVHFQLGASHSTASAVENLSRDSFFDKREAEAQHRARHQTPDGTPREPPRTKATLQRAKTTRSTVSQDSAQRPFRGQVRVATRVSEVLKEKESIGVLCCVSPGPHTSDLVLLGAGDLTQILRVPLEYLTVTVVHVVNDTATSCSDSSCILRVEVDTNQPSSSSFYLAPGSRAAVDEWALRLSCCKVPVFGMASHSSRTSTRAAYKHKDGTHGNQSRNVLNGTRPLVYWISS